MPDPTPNQNPEQIAAQTPPVAPQPTPQPLPSDTIDNTLSSASQWLQGIRARVAPVVSKVAPHVAPFVAAADAASGGALTMGKKALQTPQAKAIGEEAASTITNPQKRAEAIRGIPQTAAEFAEDEVMPPPEMLKGLRARMLPSETPTPAAEVPDHVYRARPVGQEGIGTESHAQATASLPEAQGYAKNLEDMTGKPHEVVRVDLKKTPAKYDRLQGPNGNDWIKFHEPVEEKHIETVGSEEAPKVEEKPAESDIKKTVEDAGAVFRHSKNGLVEITLPRSLVEDSNIPDKMKDFVSFNLRDNEVTPEAVKAGIQRKLDEFGIKPKASEEEGDTSFNFGANKAAPETEPFKGTHYSKVPAKEGTLLGEDRGKSMAGSEQDRLQHENKVPGVYAYREGAKAEPQIGTRTNKYDIAGDKAIADIGGAQKEQFANAHKEAYDKYKAEGDNDTIAHQKALNDAEADLRDSGYHGYEDKSSKTGSVFLFGDQKVGEPSKEMTPAIAQKIADAHSINGGSTFNLTHGNLAGTDNYAVATNPERGQILDHTPSAKDIQDFAEKNKDLLKNPDKSIGTWLDTSNNTHALDIVSTIPDREKAIELGKKNDQKAIFGLKNNEEISTGGTGKVPTAPGPGVGLGDPFSHVPPPPPSGSTRPLMKNPLSVKGTGEEGRIMTTDVLKALNQFSNKSNERLDLNTADPAAMVSRAKEIMQDEAKYQLAQANTGEAWYTNQIDTHDKILKELQPELKDPTKMSLFKFSEAVLSSGQKPYQNLNTNMKAWNYYNETGKFPPVNPETGKSWGPRVAAAYGNAMEAMNTLVSEKGEKGMVDWMLSKHPVSELKQYNKNVPGKSTDMQYGANILGEKRGPFSLNLHKMETEFTADMWVSRSWNRWMGTMEVDPKTGEIATDSPRSGKERQLMKESFSAAAKELDKTTSSMQAIMWYYEQGLYTAHGVPKESWSFSDAAERVRQNRKSGPIEEGEGTPTKPKGSISAMDFLKGLGEKK